MDRNKNILNVENGKDQSYIKVELAVTDSARINIYRVGYTVKDRADKPFSSFYHVLIIIF
jgi:alpha-L-rhamnosidase